MQFFSLFLIMALPFITRAADAPTDFKSLVGLLNGIIATLIPVVFALTFFTISWGVIKAWILNGGNEESIAQGKILVAVGVIVLAIMVSIWGILRFLIAGLFS